MPDITKTDIGRRMYQLHKEKGVEKVTVQIRESLGTDWKSFSDSDIRLLERLLSEAWVSFDKAYWEKIAFNHMKKEDVERILDVGKFLDPDKAPKTELLEALKKAMPVS
jgi:uncharacterized membrane protein